MLSINVFEFNFYYGPRYQIYKVGPSNPRGFVMVYLVVEVDYGLAFDLKCYLLFIKVMNF